MESLPTRTRIDGIVKVGYNNNRWNRPMDDDWKALQSLAIFHNLNEATLRCLVGEATHCHFKTGETIMHQGASGVTCHVIQRGRVRVFVIGEDGRELSVRILGPGEIVGEMAIFEDLPRSANVEALEETWTLELNRESLIHCLQKSPDLALKLLATLSARLRHATAEAGDLALLPVPERLMHHLEKLAHWAGRPVSDGLQIMVPMTQQELATLVGTSRESINRALVRLRLQGKIRMEGGWIIVVGQE